MSIVIRHPFRGYVGLDAKGQLCWVDSREKAASHHHHLPAMRTRNLMAEIKGLHPSELKIINEPAQND